ncbi:cobalamin B12-binding domain-containing protein [Pseudothermotoga sp. U03pept]|uniref:cobalamin B12-binding domain-containing protein n=1 Tax=Pseudothermotoga sp. U03pept TaxID=3447012 RepID=UPI003F042DFF
MFNKWGSYVPEISERALTELQNNFTRYFHNLSEKGVEKCRQDLEYHTLFLLSSLSLNSKPLFMDYCKWVRDLFLNIGVSIDSFVDSLNCIVEAIDTVLGKEVANKAREYLESGIQMLQKIETTQDTVNPLKSYVDEYVDHLLNGRRVEALNLIRKLLSSGTDVRDIYIWIFREALYKVGLLWQFGKITVAHEHFFTASTQLIMSQLYPYVFSKKSQGGPVVVAACASGELHEIGIRMICDLLEMEGFDTHYLGANTPAESIVKFAEQNKAHAILLSVTVTYHLGTLKEMINIIRSDLNLKGVKIIVGGRPFSIDRTIYRAVEADECASEVDEVKRIVLSG